MLAFVTSLRHPRNSNDYARVERLFHTTLESVTAQTSDDYVVVVVGNRKPSRPLPDRVEFVKVEFPPPVWRRGARTSRRAVLRDKGTKLVIGTLAARKHDPTHIMFFDADDFVSNRLAAHVSRHPTAHGWYVERGYVYSPERQVVARRREFHRRCGTSHIVRTDLYGLPDTLDVDATQEELIETLGDKVWRLFGSHLHSVEHLARQGTPLKPLPFPGAVYALGTGENHSGYEMKGIGRPVSARLAAEFGLPPSAPGLGAWRRAVGRQALAYSLRVGLQRLRTRFPGRAGRSAAAAAEDAPVRDLGAGEGPAS
ncbi:glycosyltransferase family 2 protein [Auraticoccus sp. F435]|uniref:Glycosyltransferase family 2 protein n=1 Tax=Auraticoccus cholistanensis TaxID=2656650 RepID=A0A6A9V1A9_9ACTN|nr:glycosyltransferase family A protein [Auraticoccus cholistanensis]MVA77089.1 glycosyltransferase family 2 protein [Auraticoccus cholistanensis]